VNLLFKDFILILSDIIFGILSLLTFQVLVFHLTKFLFIHREEQCHKFLLGANPLIYLCLPTLQDHYFMVVVQFLLDTSHLLGHFWELFLLLNLLLGHLVFLHLLFKAWHPYLNHLQHPTNMFTWYMVT